MARLLARRRDALALALLAPLLCAVLVVAARARWHSNMSVDNRTYLEMIDGVARHGLPYTTNGPSDRFPELQAEWNYQHDGRLWGTYPPVFPYVAAPIYRAGGALAVVRFNIALLALVTLGAFALGRRYLGDPLLGTAAAYVTLLAAPIWSITLDTSSYTLAIAGVVWTVHLALVALERPVARARLPAFGAGLLGALATGTHLFAFPVLAAVLLVLALLPADDARPLVPASVALPAPLRELMPTRGSLSRGLWVLLGALGPLLAVGALNRARFGSWNPVTYGPCAWQTCAASGAANQNPGAMLAFAGPTLLYAAGALGVAWLVRRSRAALAAVALVALLVLAPESELHRRTFFLLAVACAYLVDASNVPLRPPYYRLPDGLGNMYGPFVLKATLQGTPAFALALLAPASTPQERQRALVLGLPVVALYALFVLRANMPPEHAVGYSWLHFRYVMPAAPMLAALALGAVRALPWRAWHAALVPVVALALGAWLWRWDDDVQHARRYFLLRGTLLVAGLVFVLAARARRPTAPRWLAHAALYATVLALACGVATTHAVDLRALVTLRDSQDRRLDAVARSTPQRFALVGWSLELNQVLALHVTRDLQYADFWQARTWSNLHELLALWAAEGRPVFALIPARIAARPPWTGVRLTPVVVSEGLYRIEADDSSGL